MSITSRINEIETHLKEDYTNLEALGYDIPQDKNIENIASVLDNVWENQSHIEETGTTLSMNTNKGKAKVDLLGNTYQETTTGKQIFNYNSSYMENITTTLTGTGDDFTITSTGYGVRAICLGKINYSTLYGYMSSTYQSGAISIYVSNSDTYSTWSEFSNDRTRVLANWDITQTNSLSLSDYQDKYLWVLLRGANSDSDYTSVNYKNFILSKESVSAYEPYTNGATPRPDYPQDIQVVSGDNTINVEGKNLLNEKGLLNATFITGVYKYTKANFKGDRKLYVRSKLKEGKSIISGLFVAISNVGSNPNAGVSKYAISNGNVSGGSTLQDFSGYEDLYVAIYPTSYTWQDVINNYDIWVCTQSGDTYSEYQGQQSYNVNLGKNLLYNQKLPINQASVNMTYNNGIFGVNGTASISSNAYIIDYSTPLTHLEAGESLTYYIERVSGTSKVAFLTYFIPDDGSTPDYTWGVTLVANTNSNKAVKTATKSGKIDHVQFFLTKDDVYDSEVKILVQKGNIANPTWAEYITPIELCKIGTYQDKFIRNSGKNILNRATCEEDKALTWATGVTWNETGSLASDYIEVNIGDSIYANYNYQKMFYDINKNYIGALQNDGSVSTNSNGNMNSNFVVPNVNGIAYMRLGFRASSNQNVDLLTANIMVNKGETLLDYEPYGNGDWYLEKKIGKYTFTGEENWASSSYGTNTWSNSSLINTNYDENKLQVISNIFRGIPASERNTAGDNVTYSGANSSLIIRNTTLATLTEVRSATSGNYIYYYMATPTYTKIEGTLASQLEDVWRANTYDNQTNVSQVNNDLPFELYFKALGTPSNVSLLSMNRPSLQLNNPIENVEEIEEEPIEEIEESGDLDGENQESI